MAIHDTQRFFFFLRQSNASLVSLVGVHEWRKCYRAEILEKIKIIRRVVSNYIIQETEK